MRHDRISHLAMRSRGSSRADLGPNVGRAGRWCRPKCLDRVCVLDVEDRVAEWCFSTRWQHREMMQVREQGSKVIGGRNWDRKFVQTGYREDNRNKGDRSSRHGLGRKTAALERCSSAPGNREGTRRRMERSSKGFLGVFSSHQYCNGEQYSPWFLHTSRRSKYILGSGV